MMPLGGYRGAGETGNLYKSSS